MTAGSIAILRSRRRHASETVECVARGRGPSADSHAVPARAAPLRAAPAETRCRAVRSYGPRPHGSYGRNRGRHRHVVYEPAMAQNAKGRFSPREAPSAAAARCSPAVEIAIRCRAARPRPSRTPCEDRSARPPLGIGGTCSHRRSTGLKRGLRLRTEQTKQVLEYSYLVLYSLFEYRNKQGLTSYWYYY